MAETMVGWEADMLVLPALFISRQSSFSATIRL